MRTGICLILFGLILCSGIEAQQTTNSKGGKQSAVNTLTTKQVADGWIQLFDGTTDYGWKPRGEAKWTVADGVLVSLPGAPGALCTTTEFSNGDLHFECAHGPTGDAGVAVHAPADVMIDPKNAPTFNFSSGSINWTPYDLIINGDSIDLHVNGKSRGVFDRKYTGRGYIGLLTDGKGTVQYRNIRFRPTGLKSVFNGKDMTGWIAPEGNKSVFTVTKEGWLNLKGGRGDLQTIEQWGDFVLQIDVYSNGDHLNSGVFFRAEAGKFEQGYEDQIRNEWQGDDRTKPVDYGTGAVYNRLPVRKVVSSDREWFTMTLVAHGTHIGSWVNGVLVCDFTDTRPSDQTNARKGARTKAGVISLQGHEPATDLNFRNIRIVELPPAGK
jgi:hypothetical protein